MCLIFCYKHICETKSAKSMFQHLREHAPEAREKDAPNVFLQKNNQMDKLIYVAGHRGMVGSAIVRQLKAIGEKNIVVKTFVRKLDDHQQLLFTSSYPHLTMQMLTCNHRCVPKIGFRGRRKRKQS